MIFVFLDTAIKDKNNRHSYLFTAPQKIIACHDPARLHRSLQEVETRTRQGFYAAGFLSYEAGLCLQGRQKPGAKYSFPLLWFGIFSKPAVIHNFNAAAHCFSAAYPPGATTIGCLRRNITRRKYNRSVKRTKSLIALGKVYQVNYTMKYRFRFTGSPWALYRRLRAAQPVPYGAFINTGSQHILSFSPELFFRKNGRAIEVQPMKGTEALSLQDNLAGDPKNRAENIMITDLLRNDLGKISTTGSVQAYDLFKVHKLSTLRQMTSSVKSLLRPRLSLGEMLASLFPSGSVTGAPKLSALAAIRDLEKEERNIYTGAIGYITPRKRAVFSVAIRTLLLREDRGEMGLGGGITWDSKPAGEWEECLLKGSFLSDSGFRLIETMAWSAENGIPLLRLHLERLRRSADHYGFLYDQGKIIKRLSIFAGSLPKRQPGKIRLLLNSHGDQDCTFSATLNTPSTRRKVAFSDTHTDPDDPFLFHKTTHRELYNTEFKAFSKQGYYDVLFTNFLGQVTEGSISNIFLRRGDHYYTPPVSCGLLPGIYREYFMRQPGIKIKERVLTRQDLKKADAIFLTNAVRGLQEVFLDD